MYDIKYEVDPKMYSFKIIFVHGPFQNLNQPFGKSPSIFTTTIIKV